MPCQHSQLLTFLNLTHRISKIERQTDRTLSTCGEEKEEEEEKEKGREIPLLYQC